MSVIIIVIIIIDTSLEVSQISPPFMEDVAILAQTLKIPKQVLVFSLPVVFTNMKRALSERISVHTTDRAGKTILHYAMKLRRAKHVPERLARIAGIFDAIPQRSCTTYSRHRLAIRKRNRRPQGCCGV